MDAFSHIFGVGVRLRRRLLASKDFTSLTDRVFPVVSKVDETMPFVSLFRSSTEGTATKPLVRGPRKAVYQFQIFSQNWEETVRLAVAAVEALHGFRDEAVSSCLFMDASENFDSSCDAYVQILTFEVRTN